MQILRCSSRVSKEIPFCLLAMKFCNMCGMYAVETFKGYEIKRDKSLLQAVGSLFKVQVV